ncbi:MAG: hypothetical protein WCP31_07335, partial [Chloroflexales bacterium]
AQGDMMLAMGSLKRSASLIPLQIARHGIPMRSGDNAHATCSTGIGVRDVEMLKHPDDRHVMLSKAKHLSRHPERPFTSLRVTWCRDGMLGKIGFPNMSDLLPELL